ncbi:MAG: PEP-CTERM sorting domain-containing protein [Burkholderiaceae bacterium]|nr:PEP-CTERM sorting domain-containing protein [Burkholderiaceae bacterium]
MLAEIPAGFYFPLIFQLKLLSARSLLGYWNLREDIVILSAGDPVSGTMTAQTGFNTDGFLTGSEILGFAFDFGTVHISDSTHTASGAYGVNPDLSLFFLAGGMAFTGPGPDALTLTLLGADVWHVSGVRWPGAGGQGGYTVAVPEPTTLALLGLGLFGFAAQRKLRVG